MYGFMPGPNTIHYDVQGAAGKKKEHFHNNPNQNNKHITILNPDDIIFMFMNIFFLNPMFFYG